MSSVSPTYTPGAVVNGWYLASDYNWYPVPVQQPQVVVAPSNGGTTAALWIIIAILTSPLWIIIAILTSPVWIWFTPIIAVLGLAVGLVWGAIAGIVAAGNKFGVAGTLIVCGAYLAAVVGVFVWIAA